LKILGIDPGATGALALLDGETLLDVLDMPVVEIVVSKKNRKIVSPTLVAETIKTLAPDRIMLEKVGTRPGEGAVGAFSFGRSFGIVEGVIAALGVPMEYTYPAAWKRALGVPADKGGARNRAMALWPQAAKSFARVKDDGRAEACLIALFAARSL
jgi:crossover junction endodeoxyribonuclease RuvC